MATAKQKKTVKSFYELYKNHAGKFIYLVHCGGFYKIGMTFNLDNRLNSLQCGNPFELDLVFAVRCIDALEVEELLHERFKDKHHFREWYSLSEDDITFIKNLVD